MLERGYTEGFKQQAVQKLLARGKGSAPELAKELGCSVDSLYRWSKNMQTPSVNKSTKDHSAQERFNFVMLFASIPANEQGVWLRQNGLTSELLMQWKESMLESLAGAKVEPGLGRLKKQIRGLEQDLKRKEKKLKQKELIIDVQKKVLEIFREDQDELPAPMKEIG